MYTISSVNCLCFFLWGLHTCAPWDSYKSNVTNWVDNVEIHMINYIHDIITYNYYICNCKLHSILLTKWIGMYRKRCVLVGGGSINLYFVMRASNCLSPPMVLTPPRACLVKACCTPLKAKSLLQGNTLETDGWPVHSPIAQSPGHPSSSWTSKALSSKHRLPCDAIDANNAYIYI